MPSLVLWVVLCQLLFLSVPPDQRPGEKRQPLSPEARALIRQASSAVGLIFVRNAGDPEGQPPRLRASAVVIRSDGVIATNYHVIAQDGTEKVYDEIIFSLSPVGDSTGARPERYRVRPVVVNKPYDLALLRIIPEGAGNENKLPAIELADSRSVQLLDDLVVIGFPERAGSTLTVNTGIVEGIDKLDHWIKTDARLMHGNSGGAAVDGEGKLIGIPTKVIVDSQPIDKNGDGFPDEVRRLGTVGFLRPAYLLASMLGQLGTDEQKSGPVSKHDRPPSPDAAPQAVEPPVTVIVRGVIRSAITRKPVAGARVGLVPLGTDTVSAVNLLTWGGANADGEFELNKRVPPGRYTLKASAFGYGAFSQDIEVKQNAEGLVIELRPSS
jgi:S1-C subfamily serine protease